MILEVVDVWIFVDQFVTLIKIDSNGKCVWFGRPMNRRARQEVFT
jgi:hypothetical protein